MAPRPNWLVTPLPRPDFAVADGAVDVEPLLAALDERLGHVEREAVAVDVAEFAGVVIVRLVGEARGLDRAVLRSRLEERTRQRVAQRNGARHRLARRRGHPQRKCSSCCGSYLGWCFMSGKDLDGGSSSYSSRGTRRATTIENA